MTYEAPVQDILFALKAAADLPRLVASGINGGLDEDTIRAVLAEAARFAGDVLEPLNWPGDQNGCRLDGGKVDMTPGWTEAYRQFTAGGWSALPCPPEFGGQGLPSIIAMPVCEIWNAANMAFDMCPLLTNSAIDSLHIGGSDEMKALYLPRMISDEWTGTMNRTEPHAGSDLNAVATRADREPDATYRITGTKIFISYGDHELTQNIIHLVLARSPDAPSGTRGISLFLVPKFLVNACVGLGNKLGIHASPTCVMKFGERDGAIGYLVGQENRGLHTMFIMMNAARLAVGVQGVAMADRALQRASRYACERRQGRTAGTKPGDMAPIALHPDVRRTLLTMRALTAAARAICLATAAATDLSHLARSEAERDAAAQRVALLTPIAKAFSTDIAVGVASMGVQIHGGMGFVEETGAAQHLRDARILPIYEGTNGIQAIDLATRKLPLGGGEVVKSYLAEMSANIAEVGSVNDPAFAGMAAQFADTHQALKEATVRVGGALETNPEAALAGATPYLRLFGLAVGGHYLAKGTLLACRSKSGAQDEIHIALARFFANNISIAGPGLARSITSGADSILSACLDEATA